MSNSADDKISIENHTGSIGGVTRFPKSVSFTITNACNLRCSMCGQWSEEGYMHDRKGRLKQEMELADWERLVDELAVHNVPSVLLRGGEPLLFPGIMGLLEYMGSKGIFTSIDTNGTMLKEYAADIVRIGNIHLTISVDGPEEVHDAVRGVKGCFNRIGGGVALLNALEESGGHRISKSIFCVDFPDYSIGNVKESTIEDAWNSERAARFRAYRRRIPLSVCYRCRAKYMSEIEA